MDPGPRVAVPGALSVSVHQVPPCCYQQASSPPATLTQPEPVPGSTAVETIPTSFGDVNFYLLEEEFGVSLQVGFPIRFFQKDCSENL